MTDHEPLRVAAEAGEVIPLFVLDPFFFSPDKAALMPYRMQFLLASLEELAGSLRARGSDLVLVSGQSVDIVPRLVAQWKADCVRAHRWTEPFGRERDRRIAAALGDRFRLHEGELLSPPGALLSGAGTPYAVFTAFARAFIKQISLGSSLEAPRNLPAVPELSGFERAGMPTLASLGLPQAPGLLTGGEAAGDARLRSFLAGAAEGYAEGRDHMAIMGTSRLSQDLKFGTLSVRHVWHRASEIQNAKSKAVFRNELLWREFNHNVLWHRPELLQAPFKKAWEGFPYEGVSADWQAWEAGATGYPIVDASQRQLAATGFVHNRARMISASFLTKHLLVDYRKGEAHYMKWLTDGDWANNNAGWQWSAGCGADAQPYFRVFNPVTQGKKFDPEGSYVRQWLPELKAMPTKWIHAPWEAPPEVLRQAEVVLGRSYPHPVVDHATARGRFLALAGEHLRAKV